MDRCALFVDAGYLLADGAMAVHGTRRRDSVSWDYPGLLHLLAGLARDRSGLPVLRCYWYDPAAGSYQTAAHDVLADLPGLKLRQAAARPALRDGGETGIRADLVTLARNRAVSDAVVVSADESLAQVLAEVQDLGIRVIIVHVSAEGSRTASRALRQECDDIIEVSGAHLRAFADLTPRAEVPHEEDPPANGRSEAQDAGGGHDQASVTAAGPDAPSLARQPGAGREPVPAGGAMYPAPVTAHYQPAGEPAGAAAAAAGGYVPQSRRGPGPRSGQAVPEEAAGQSAAMREPGADGTGPPAPGPGHRGGQEDPPVQAHPPSPAQAEASAPRTAGPADGASGGRDGGPRPVPPDPGRNGRPPVPAPGQAEMPGAAAGIRQPGSGGTVAGNGQRYGVSPNGYPGAAPGELPQRGPAGDGMPRGGLPGGGVPAGDGYAPPRADPAGARPPYGGPAPAQPPYAGPAGEPHYGGSAVPAAYPGTAPEQPPYRGPAQPPVRYGETAPGRPRYPGSEPQPGYAGQPSAGHPAAAGLGPGQGLAPQSAASLADSVRAAHAEGYAFGAAVASDSPALWLEAVLARKPRMPADLEARLLQGSVLPIDSLLHDEVRHALRRGFWDALDRSRR